MEKKKQTATVPGRLIHGNFAPIDPSIVIRNVNGPVSTMSVWFVENGCEYNVERAMTLKDEIALLRALRDGGSVACHRMNIDVSGSYADIVFECDDDPISMRVWRKDLAAAASRFPVRLLDTKAAA